MQLAFEHARTYSFNICFRMVSARSPSQLTLRTVLECSVSAASYDCYLYRIFTYPMRNAQCKCPSPPPRLCQPPPIVYRGQIIYAITSREHNAAYIPKSQGRRPMTLASISFRSPSIPASSGMFARALSQLTIDD